MSGDATASRAGGSAPAAGGRKAAGGATRGVPMSLKSLQLRLAELGYEPGAADGIWGPKTERAVIRAMTEGPDTPLTDADFVASAGRLGCPVSHIRAVSMVESTGRAFIDGRPAILFERHRFSRATGGRFDRSHPAISWPTWEPRSYPASQTARYGQLVAAVGLDVDAGFASASYGRFQILGENFAACGHQSPFAFALAMAQGEPEQLLAFERFIVSRGLLRALQRGDWATFARGYNGTAYKKNRYDAKLATFVRQFEARA